MTEVTVHNPETTISSLEMADLVKSRHEAVKAVIDRLVERGVIVKPPMVFGRYQDSVGRESTEQVYIIPKRDSYIIVAQLSPEFTAAIVDRWQELEIVVQQQTQQLLATTQAQLKLTTAASNNLHSKLVQLEAEQLTRSYLLEELKVDKVKHSKELLKSSEVHVKNLNSIVARLQSEVADLKNLNSALKEGLADARYEAKTAQTALKAAKLSR